MYVTNDLRTKLQEWKNRLYNAHITRLNSDFNSFMRKIEITPPISSILEELVREADSLESNPFQTYDLLGNKIDNCNFKNDRERAIYHYALLKKLNEDEVDIVGFVKLNLGASESFVTRYIDQLVHYISERLDEGTSVLYLLEKYKKRCEWFYKKELIQLYKDQVGTESQKGNQEEALDKDLRKFLFDQGIDYPFSKPSSPSGEADVVGLLHTKDPLVLEVKIFDRNNKSRYGKERIVQGFTQIVKYSNDYNKAIGYLLVFNMDKAEVDLVIKQNDNKLPARVVFNGKTYFVIFVNLPPLDTESASKRGKIEKVTLNEEELTSEISH